MNSHYNDPELSTNQPHLSVKRCVRKSGLQIKINAAKATEVSEQERISTMGYAYAPAELKPQTWRDICMGSSYETTEFLGHMAHRQIIHYTDLYSDLKT